MAVSVQLVMARLPTWNERVVLVELEKALQLLSTVEAHDIRDFSVADAGAPIAPSAGPLHN